MSELCLRGREGAVESLTLPLRSRKKTADAIAGVIVAWRPMGRAG